MTLVIGLTGSIATGKSTVSNMLRELGIPIVDADQIAREVVKPGEVAYEKIVKTFGDAIVQSDGLIDRKKLGAIVFSNDEQRKKLNAIVHPEVRKKMIMQREYYKEQGYKAVILDIPLLFESGLTDYVEKTLVVYVEESTQLKRLMKRDNSTKEEALQRMQSQYPIKDKIKLADAVINNNGSLDETREQLLALLKKWNVI
ncbi:dephospho-CoA kinase [Salirhabdus sp. Marseille-P4669]|uniref:dephospho-CoA kinase n=1 Tax=Salirhabdus sp. Marseille-P4669 TaxID=2042310 RepID=UPI000C79B869|nr:dephospho-CoA kinase [Salirhabdus sp. Marseille-P4669]